MRKISLVLVMVAVGCGGGTDLSSPESAAQSFIDAAAAKDVDALSECVSKDCTGEMKTLLDKTCPEEALDELAQMFEDGTVGEVNANEAGDRASVDVKLPKFARGEETLKLVKEGDAWKVRDF